MENNGVFYAEPSLFEIFDYTWLSGNATRLKEPNTIVLSRHLAEKYFGDWKQALGKTIQLWSWRAKFMVTGVFQDLPSNTDIPVEMAMAYTSLHPYNPDNTNNINLWSQTDNVFKTECFLLLSKNQHVHSLEKSLPSFVEKYYKQAQDLSPIRTILAFQPLGSMHLDERYDTYKGDALPVKELWSLGLIGLFILVIACINFINLSTAQSVNQSKEIGIRKVLGSDRSRIIWQFLFETALITLVAIILGYLLSALALPYLNKMTGKSLRLRCSGQSLCFAVFFLCGWSGLLLCWPVYTRLCSV